VRDYAPGDDRRRIHWKATARTGKLMSRLETGEEQQNISIILSTCRYDKKPADYLPVENRMLEIALAIARFFLTQNIPVRTYHREEALSENSVGNNASFAEYYEVHSKTFFFPNQTDARLFESLRGADAVLTGRAAFLILGKWNASAEDFVRLLNANGVSVVVYIVSPAASDFPEGLSFPRTELIPIAPDAKLEEVL
ncbi:MAG: DUF58 domain-containing protein, partial [Lachnospiraceae bacterium]|nr:DUF58 domain-containing protein [Lachnospiraceae bacterium]